MYQSTYFSDDFNRDVTKNLKTNEIELVHQKIYTVHQKIYTEQVLMVKIYYCHVILCLNIKRLRFTSEPVT